MNTLKESLTVVCVTESQSSLKIINFNEFLDSDFLAEGPQLFGLDSSFIRERSNFENRCCNAIRIYSSVFIHKSKQDM